MAARSALASDCGAPAIRHQPVWRTLDGPQRGRNSIRHARQKELTEKRRVLFPISLVPFEKIRDWKSFDAGAGKDSAREIREYFIPDFSNWKDNDVYQRAWQRLLMDLKSEKAGPVEGR